MSNTTNISIKAREIIEKNNLNLQKDGVLVVLVKDVKRGFLITKKILRGCMDKNTVLFLSGGSTPKPLYKLLAKEKKLDIGAVAMVDERCGLPPHKNSNERMIKETGLIDYLSSKNIPFYSILRRHLEGVRLTAIKYDKVIKKLFSSFPKRIAIMGIGEDGHTAGLRAGIKNSKLKTQNYVIGISDFPGDFRERITLTFKALSQMDLLIVLVFGSAKQNGLSLMLTRGSKEEVPARFFKRPDIAKKTILITDQKV